MKIVGLVGKSGTGKSYKAISLARDLNIEYIIDDGLFIKGNKIIAGKSAKGEESKISAVKRALFMDDHHRLDVRMAIQQLEPEVILVIGTSDNMINKISRALGFSNIERIIYIEDISSEEEIAIAQEERKKQGKHVIPVPAFEVKKDFSGYFIDSLKIFKNRNNINEQSYEKTVVRPNFSYLGKYTISDTVIKDITKFVAGKSEDIKKVYSIYSKNYKEGLVIYLDVSLVYNSNNIVNRVKKVQQDIYEEVEKMTSLNILGVNITIKKVKFDEEKGLYY